MTSLSSPSSLARLCLAALAIAAGTGTARAEFRQDTTPGSACKVDGPATTRTLKAIQSRMGGTSNRDADNAINIVCPIPRTQSAIGNIALSVDGKVNPGRTLSCTVQTIAPSGEVRSSRSFTQTGFSSGSETRLFTQNLTLFADQLDPFDYVSMQCLMPPNVGATIIGIRTMEQL